MIVLLITQQEFLIDYILYNIKNMDLPIKLIILPTVPKNYDDYDGIITDIVNEHWHSIKLPLLLLTNSPINTIKINDFYNLILPLQTDELINILQLWYHKINFSNPLLIINNSYKTIEDNPILTQLNLINKNLCKIETALQLSNNHQKNNHHSRFNDHIIQNKTTNNPQWINNIIPFNSHESINYQFKLQININENILWNNEFWEDILHQPTYFLRNFFLKHKNHGVIKIHSYLKNNRVYGTFILMHDEWSWIGLNNLNKIIKDNPHYIHLNINKNNHLVIKYKYYLKSYQQKLYG